MKNTGYYDQVIAYPDLNNDLENNATTIVDMAGNSKLLLDSSQLLNENLKFVSLIGLTDWTAQKDFKEVPNSKFFFAPAFAQIKFEEWGIEKTNKIIAQKLASFTNSGKEWLDIALIKNKEELSNLYHEMLKGKVDPSKGYIVNFS